VCACQAVSAVTPITNSSSRAAGQQQQQQQQGQLVPSADSPEALAGLLQGSNFTAKSCQSHSSLRL